MSRIRLPIAFTSSEPWCAVYDMGEGKFEAYRIVGWAGLVEFDDEVDSDDTFFGMVALEQDGFDPGLEEVEGDNLIAVLPVSELPEDIRPKPITLEVLAELAKTKRESVAFYQDLAHKRFVRKQQELDKAEEERERARLAWENK